MIALKLQNVNKHYGKKHALKDFTKEFNTGIYGLLGPNGSGKTTLMNIITDTIGMDKGGRVEWNGNNIYELGNAYRSEIGFMPQQQGLYESFTPVRFLGYIAGLKGLSKAEAKEQIPEVLKQVELLDVAKKRAGSFSGGMKQRLLIAQALLGNPKMLILDEPTAGLDPRQRVIIRELIAKFAKEKIVIISTHIVSDIETIADEILLIKEGVLIKQGTPEELIAEHGGERGLEDVYMHYFEE
jgi:ABC-type multidrug transport system ATPase subunit